MVFCMEVQKFESGDHLFREGQNYKNMVIVYEGMLEIYTEMDNGTQFPIEYCFSGSVINAH